MAVPHIATQVRTLERLCLYTNSLPVLLGAVTKSRPLALMLMLLKTALVL